MSERPASDAATRQEFSLSEIETRLDDLRLTEDVIELRREVDALLAVAKAAQGLVEAADAAPIPLTSATAFRWDAMCRALARFAR